MTQVGKYRFEAPFTIDGKPETEYKAWVEFELKQGVDGIGVHTFKASEIVYIDGSYSYVQTVDTAPTYSIVNGMQLLEMKDDNAPQLLGTFEEIIINNDNFDSRFRWGSECWHEGISLQNIKKNSKRVWQLYTSSNSDTPCLYVLLEQKDGTFYLGFGYYNSGSVNAANSDDSHIRWLYKLTEVNSSDFEALENLQSSSMEKLKQKYPQFFELSTDGGLTVYIWQMTANNYHCYLANTFTEAVADSSFAYKVGTSIAEMRTILTTYDIKEKDIYIVPIRNPLSNYYYEINDAYRAKIKEMFWADIPLADASQYSPLITLGEPYSIYEQFLEGNKTALDKNKNEKYLKDYFLVNNEEEMYTYTFFDMTGDGSPELCVNNIPEMYFFTVKNGEVYHWYTETNGYSRLLNNGAFLIERHGAAPTHINYEYYELDKNASKKFSISFSWWDTWTDGEKEYPEFYEINGKEVSKAEYEEKTKEYLSVGADIIAWYSKKT